MLIKSRKPKKVIKIPVQYEVINIPVKQLGIAKVVLIRHA